MKFSFWEKFTKNKYIPIIISLLFLAVIYLIFGFINSLIVILHLTVFLALSKLLIYIIQKIRKKEFKKKIFKIFTINDIRNIIGILVTVIYLGIGFYLSYHIFETRYTIYTDKEIGFDNFEIVLISDSHIGNTLDGDRFYKEIEKLSKINTNIYVIDGDFVDDDTSREDMIKACSAFSQLNPTHGIYYVYGNHDRGYFNYRNFTEEELINELQKNKVIILKDEVLEINDYIYLIGREDRSNSNRLSIKELTDGLELNRYMISLNHQPNDYENEKNANIDLVLSGHSHGGQMIPLGYVGLLLGQNDNFYGLEKRDNTNFIVTSGISSWAVKFKTGTKSEYVIIDIKRK